MLFLLPNTFQRVVLEQDDERLNSLQGFFINMSWCSEEVNLGLG